ncbi:MAG: hypothetical protein H6719_06775 [Sandaracinaceae bacterium]|nr:hypothetical protein [Sandaracinaceae bacterium]
MARRTLEQTLAQLAADTAEPASEAARRALLEALPKKTSFVVAQAANVIRDHALDGFGDALETAYEHFAIEGAKRDPGCRAKLAIVEALDATDRPSISLFERAARVVQLEPTWGPPEDTAAPVRARAALALARAPYTDFVLIAGELLADPAPSVRRAALLGLGTHGDRAGAGLARYHVALGDDDPLVTAEAMSTLLALAPDVGIGALSAFVDGEDPTARELALIALGESRRPAALDVLLAHLEARVLSEERATVMTALALHRSEPALRVLLVWVGGRDADAAAALEALAIRRHEGEVVERAREAAAEAGRLDAFREAFRLD